MKFLLVALNAKYIHSNPGIYSLRAYAGEYGKHVEIAEYTINNRMEEILSDLYKRKPDAIGFSCYIWNITEILLLVGELKKIMPQVPIWLGGPEVTYGAMDILSKNPGIEGIMIGEGEETFLELLQYYLKNTFEAESIKLSNIRGLALPNGMTPQRPLTDISKLPFLYKNLDEFENKIIYYESSRGCPFRCSYCLSSIDKKVRLRNVEIVKKELQFFLDHNVSQVKFVDRTFNCNHEHAMGIWKYLLEHDNGITNFHFEISADLLKAEELEILRAMRPGAVQLEIGVQSTNADTILEIDRSMNLDILKEVVKKIKDGKNIHQHLDLIAGLPYEDYHSFGRSFNEVYAMEPEQLQLGFLKVLKGSKMHEKAEEYGLSYLTNPPYEVLVSKWLPYDDVLRLKQMEEMVELYYNSSQFTRTLAFLVKEFETPFVMFEQLAAFYERNGYFVTSPSRAYRYQVLFDFICEFLSEDKKEFFRELLAVDLYLRENLKTRPNFLADPIKYKEVVRIFYREESQNRVYLPDYAEYDAKQLAKMTHLEPINYQIEGNGHRLDETEFILFDYKNRSSLTHEARVSYIKF